MHIDTVLRGPSDRSLLPVRVTAPEPGDRVTRDATVPEVDGVLTAATLAAVAFRLRDEHGLVEALRGLVAAVDAFERVSDA